MSGSRRLRRRIERDLRDGVALQRVGDVLAGAAKRQTEKGEEGFNPEQVPRRGRRAAFKAMRRRV